MKEKKENISLIKLFWDFFLIGSYSFGGYMALVSIVQKDMVEKKKILTNEQILDGISLASILPGPVAVNAVTYYGYILSGVKGAIVSFLGILLPTFLLVTAFSVYYFSVGDSVNIDFHISFVIPVVVAVIVAVGFKMAKKQIKVFSQVLIAVLAFLMSISTSNVFILIMTIVVGGVAGYFLYKEPNSKGEDKGLDLFFISKKDLNALLITVVCVLSFILLLAFTTGQLKDSLSISYVFAGMSLTLFGGGYVIIPIMEQALVGDLAWVTTEEFNAAISVSQITPGPIMTSVTFIGYKIAGITGGIISTLAIFMPSSILMILLSQFQQKIKHLSVIGAIMNGMRAVVIGLIFSGAYVIGLKHFDANIMPWIILLTSFLLFAFTRAHPALIILITLILSFI